jgi:hypothetical protein
MLVCGGKATPGSHELGGKGVFLDAGLATTTRNPYPS